MPNNPARPPQPSPPPWHSLPEPVRQRVVAQLVALLAKQLRAPQPEVKDESPSENQS